jgi:hypothetical protein
MGTMSYSLFLGFLNILPGENAFVTILAELHSTKPAI